MSTTFIEWIMTTENKTIKNSDMTVLTKHYNSMFSDELLLMEQQCNFGYIMLFFSSISFNKQEIKHKIFVIAEFRIIPWSFGKRLTAVFIDSY